MQQEVKPVTAAILIVVVVGLIAMIGIKVFSPVSVGHNSSPAMRAMGAKMAEQNRKLMNASGAYQRMPSAPSGNQ